MPSRAAIPESSILGRILLLQNAVHAFGDASHVAEAVTAALGMIPGVVSCELCLEAMGRLVHRTPGRSEPEAPQALRWIRRLETPRADYGVMTLELDDPGRFAPYEPFIANTANLVALHLENIKITAELQTFNARLSSQVSEQTASLYQSELRFRTLFERMEQGVVYQDARAQIISANPAAKRILGAGNNELLGQTSRQVVHIALREDGTEMPESEFPSVTAVRTGRPVLGMVVGIVDRTGGEPRWIEVDAIPESGSSESGPFHVFTTFTDITERLRAQRVLRESEMRFRALFEESPVPKLLLDLETGTIIQGNEAAARTLTYAREELAGLPLRELGGGLDSEWVVARLRGALAGEPVEFDLAWRARSGGTRDFFVKGTRLEVEGRTLSYVCLIDITDRKRMERELQAREEQLLRLNTSLEERVAERTATLESTNRELESFAYSVSHDLRAPLRGISGWSLALEEEYGEQLDERGRRYLKTVRGETVRMAELIDALLQLSRLSRTPMQAAPVDLSAVALAVAGRLEAENPERKIAFRVEPELVATGDRRLLEVALTNLLSNAVKFTSRCPDARIEFCQVEVDGKPVFRVRDNGVGFDMAHADRLFGAFQRLHRTSEFPGTGIGLATVQRIVLRHNGRIWPESSPGHGASFYFTLGQG